MFLLCILEFGSSLSSISFALPLNVKSVCTVVTGGVAGGLAGILRKIGSNATANDAPVLGDQRSVKVSSLVSLDRQEGNIHFFH